MKTIYFFLISFFQYCKCARIFLFWSCMFDAENKEPLAFVNIKDVSPNNGCIRTEGAFLLKSEKN